MLIVVLVMCDVFVGVVLNVLVVGLIRGFCLSFGVLLIVV